MNKINCQQRSATAAGIPVVDQHVRKRGGGPNGLVKLLDNCGFFPWRKKFDLLQNRFKGHGKCKARNNTEEGHGVVFTLLSKQGHQSVAEM